MVQEHDIEQNAHDLRQRRVFLVRSFFLMLQTFAADTDGKHLLCSQTDDRTERLLQAQTTVAKERRAARGFQSYRLKDQRNGRRRANVVHGDLGRQGHAPAPVPHGMALRALNEEIAFARVVVGRRNGERVKMAALDIVLDPAAIEVGPEKVPQGSRIQQRPGVASSQNRPKREVEYPDEGIVGLR